MKAKLYVCIILTALIAVFTISGCTEETTVADKLAASTDEVIANVIENVTDATAITTVASTETTVGETTTAPEATTKAEEVTEPKVNNQTSDKTNTSNADKTENNASTQKPNNTSNGNTSGNTTTNKPSSNTSNNNTEKPKPVETKPKETQPPATEAPVVITDDTPLTFEQMNTEEMMQRMVDDCIEYFTSLDMTYDESLDPSWAGWFYGWQGGFEYTAVRSYNQNSLYNIEGLKSQIDAFIINYHGYEYKDISFKPCYELTDKGTYNIIFCYG